MKEAIRQRARQLGFDDCRFTHAAPPARRTAFDTWLAAGRQGEMGWMERSAVKRRDLQAVLPGARSIITLAVNYNPPPRDDSTANSTGSPNEPRGQVARYARHADYHDVLAAPLKTLAEFVESTSGSDTRCLWYVDTGPILERELAERSGIGFVGKHTNVISRQFGNWILLAEILTTLELEPDPPEKNRCGSCTRCLAACPTQAITAPFQLDARRCISYLTIELKGPIPEELRPAIGDRIFGCDDCLAVCPWNRFAQTGRLLRPHARPDLTEPALLELLQLDDAQFKRRFAGTPLLRSKRRGLLRNVCVALGNVGTAAVLPALARAAADPEPLIAEHARWAAAQINSRKK
jgi:epoxyqueuosine reductase